MPLHCIILVKGLVHVLQFLMARTHGVRSELVDDPMLILHLLYASATCYDEVAIAIVGL